ncbi:MAG: hypothetical protein ACK55Z_17315, partial [bacterium]
ARTRVNILIISLYVLTPYSKYPRALTFENLSQRLTERSCMPGRRRTRTCFQERSYFRRLNIQMAGALRGRGGARRMAKTRSEDERTVGSG